MYRTLSHSPVTTKPRTEHIRIQNDYIRVEQQQGTEQTGVNESGDESAYVSNTKIHQVNHVLYYCGFDVQVAQAR